MAWWRPWESSAPDASPRLPWWRRWFGSRSERAAARYLRGLGYRILARNYRCPLGELDLVVLDKETVVFVEVRSSAGRSSADIALSVDDAKQARLTRLALHFLKHHRLLDRSARFDVLTLAWPATQRTPIIEHFPNAFPAAGRYQMFS